MESLETNSLKSDERVSLQAAVYTGDEMNTGRVAEGDVARLGILAMNTFSSSGDTFHSRPFKVLLLQCANVVLCMSRIAYAD